MPNCSAVTADRTSESATAIELDDIERAALWRILELECMKVVDRPFSPDPTELPEIVDRSQRALRLLRAWEDGVLPPESFGVINSLTVDYAAEVRKEVDELRKNLQRVEMGDRDVFYQGCSQAKSMEMIHQYLRQNEQEINGCESLIKKITAMATSEGAVSEGRVIA